MLKECPNCGEYTLKINFDNLGRCSNCDCNYYRRSNGIQVMTNTDDQIITIGYGPKGKRLKE